MKNIIRVSVEQVCYKPLISVFKVNGVVGTVLVYKSRPEVCPVFPLLACVAKCYISGLGHSLVCVFFAITYFSVSPVRISHLHT